VHDPQGRESWLDGAVPACPGRPNRSRSHARGAQPGSSRCGCDTVTLERVVVFALIVLVIGWSTKRLAQWWTLWHERMRAAPQAPRPVAAPKSAPRHALATLREPPTDDDLVVTVARVILESRLANPLAILSGLRLEDAIDLTCYAAAATAFIDRNHGLEIDIGGSVVTVVTNVHELALKSTHLTFEVTSAIRADIARGTVQLVHDGDGKLLAMVRDTRTGKVTDLLRGVPSGARLGALTAAVYGLAHLVSAKDLAAKLDALAAKVDVFAAFRSIDQHEAVYARVKELGMKPLDAPTLAELRSLRQEVRELRHVWRGEVVLGLEVLRDPPPANGLRRLLPGPRARHVAVRDGTWSRVGRPTRPPPPFLLVPNGRRPPRVRGRDAPVRACSAARLRRGRPR
jgi:hypothetical protein